MIPSLANDDTLDPVFNFRIQLNKALDVNLAYLRKNLSFGEFTVRKIGRP